MPTAHGGAKGWPATVRQVEHGQDAAALREGYHCVRCGLDSLSVPSGDFLDWEVSCVDDRVIVCPECMSTGQLAPDAVEVALLALADVPRTPADNTFEDPAAREAVIGVLAPIATD